MEPLPPMADLHLRREDEEKIRQRSHMMARHFNPSILPF